LKNFLSIEYTDISLEKEQLNYSIYLDDVEFNVSIPKVTWGDKLYKWIFTSEYVLNTTDHYFTWVFLQIYTKHDDPLKMLLFNKGGIFIAWKVHITDIREAIEGVMNNIDFYNIVYSEIINIWWAQNIVLQYTPSSDKITIKFDSWGNKYTILAREGKIESIYKWSSKITSGDISTSQIKNYID
jgi:hypothetical protein